MVLNLQDTLGMIILLKTDIKVLYLMLSGMASATHSGKGAEFISEVGVSTG
jgi:hypothetical protein